MKQRLAALITVCVSTAVALLIAELVLRVVAPQILSMPFPRLRNGMRVAHANATGRIAVAPLYDIHVHFNSDRFRADRDFAPSPPPGRTRIAVLGDSFVFGWGVEAGQSFPAQLEAILRSRGDDVEVINAGVPGQSLGEKALWYRDAVAPFKPQIVVLAVLVDDIDSENGLHLFQLRNGEAVPLPPKPGELNTGLHRLPGYDYVSQHSHLVALVKRAIATGLRRNPRNRVFVEAGDVSMNRTLFLRDGLPLVDAEIRWLRREVAAHGSSLMVVYLPFRETVYPSAVQWMEQARWKESTLAANVGAECARDGIPFLDLTSRLQHEAATSPQELYYKGADTHPNARGYRAFAAGVAEFIEPSLRSSRR